MPSTDASRDGVLLAALDIETDTDGVNGLDPTESRVLSAALAFSDREPLVFESESERDLLLELDAALTPRSGLLVTWNGAGFDLPFIAARARSLRLDLSLVTVADAALPVKYAPPVGLGLPVRARWGGTAHVDVAFLYQRFAESHGVAWSLKAVARAAGLDPVEVDRSRIHELTAAELREYVLSDVAVTLQLASRLRTADLLRAVLPLEL